MQCRECLGPPGGGAVGVTGGAGAGGYGGGVGPGGGEAPDAGGGGGGPEEGLAPGDGGGGVGRSMPPDSASALASTASGSQVRVPSKPPSQMNYLPGGAGDEQLPAEVEDPWCQESNPRIVRFEDVTKASYIIKSGVYFTPCDQSHMPVLTGMDIYLKKDFLQHTGSFKERGARYAMLMLPEDQRRRGIISASAGNHALAICYHGRLLSIPVTVVMPTTSPLMKVQNCRAHGATVIVKGANMTEAKLWAMHWGKEQGLMYLNGYDHPHILAGQGTCGLEIVEQVPDLAAVVVPVGGCGLLAGVAVAVKNMKPGVKVIAVQSESCQSFVKAMQEGRPVMTTLGPTIAEGLAVAKSGVNAYATAAPLVDKVVSVPESCIAMAILRLVELEKCVVEGAGACGLGAVLSGQLEELRGKKVVLILTGGNIDTTVLGRVLDRGLAVDGRLVKFTVPLVDRPGGLQELCRLTTAMGVSIKDLAFERAWMKDDVFKMKAHVVCETRDAEHAKELQAALKDTFQLVIFGDVPFPENGG